MKMRKEKDTLVYSIFRPIVKGLFYFLYRPRIIGLENVPKEGPFVLAGNHTKWLDPVMLVAINKCHVHFLAKSELFHGMSSIVAKGMGCIPVNRKIHDKNVLINAYNYLNTGHIIGVFPEGTINRTDDTIMPFKMGAIKIASETKSLLVPFVIKGEYKLFKRSIEIEFLKPRKISKDLEEENQKLMNIVRKNLDNYYKSKGCK